MAGLLVALQLTTAASIGSPAIDAAVADLRATGVHVSPRALGEASEDARVRLIAARAELARERREVALVIAPGPVGSRGMTAYARRLHREADLPGALLVTTPGRGVAFWGIDPRPRAARAIAASGADREANPVTRLTVAARGVVAPSPEPDGVREVLILILLAGLGAAWAGAWGSSRAERARRRMITEDRTHLRLWIDTLRAQAAALDITHLAPGDRGTVDGVLAMCADTLTGLHTARTRADIAALKPRVDEGFASLAAIRHETPGSDPFSGLCRTDPAHGRALATDPGDEAGPPRLCRDCAAAAARGQPPSPRQVPLGSAVVPYTALHQERGFPTGAGAGSPAADRPRHHGHR